MRHRLSSGYFRLFACFVALVALTAGACSRDPEVAKREHLERAKALIAKQDYPAAIIQLRNALQYDDKFGEARMTLADALVANGEGKRAIVEFVRAADLLPNSTEAQLKAGNALLVDGKFQDAEARADRVLKSEPSNPSALLLKGHALAGLKRIDDAIDQIEEAVAMNAGVGARMSLGMLQMQQGQRAAAESTFQRAVDAAPQSVDAHLAFAQFYWASNRIADAERILVRAVAIDPSAERTNRAMAAFYIATKRAPEAEKHLKTAVEHSKEPGAALILADYYVLVERHQDALQVLRSVAKDDSPVAIAASIRAAEIEYASGQREQARNAIDLLLAKNPKVAPANVVKARFLLAEGKLQEALARAQNAVTLDTTSAAAHYTLGLIHVALNDATAASAAFTEVLKINPQAADAQTRLAALHLAGGNPGAAVQMAEAALRTRQADREAELLLVRGLSATGETARAENGAKTLVTRHPDWAAAHTTYANIQLKKRNFSGAEEGFRRALQLQAEDTDALRGLVTAMVNTKRTPEARKLVTGYVDAHPKSAAAIVLLADLDFAERDTAAGERNLTRAIEADPDYFLAYDRLARHFLSQKRLPEATAKYEAVVQRAPRDLMAQTMLAVLLQLQNREEDARARYERILAIDANAVVPNNNLALMYAERGTNLDVALQHAQAAKAAKPDDPDVNDTLGWVYYKRGLHRMAVEPLEQSVRSNPSNAVYQYHLGLTLMKLGEVAKGKAALEAALKMQPDAPLANEAKQALAAM